MSNTNDNNLAVISEKPHSETMPAMVDPPEHPCVGCPHRQRKSEIVVTEYSVHWRGVDIKATMGEVRVITALVAHQGEYVSYRLLYDKLKQMPGFIAGQGDDGYKSNMRSVIKRIRRKFTHVDPTWNMIKNCTGYGYAWGRRE